MQHRFSNAQFSAIAQWVLKIPGVTDATAAIIAHTGATAEQLPVVREQFERIVEILGKLTNLEVGASPRLVDAYGQLGVEFLSGWELSELQTLEALAAGTYDRYETAGRRDANGPSWDDLMLLVVFGGIEKARPLLRRYADEEAATSWAGYSAFVRWTANDEVAAPDRETLVGGAHGFRALALLYGDRDVEAAAPILEAAVERNDRKLSTRAVKTEAKLFVQIDAYLRGRLPEKTMKSSLESFLGYSAHTGWPTGLRDKEPAVYIYNRLFQAEQPAHRTWEFLRTRVKVLQRTERHRYALDVPPVRDGIQRMRAIVEAGPFAVERDPSGVRMWNV